jgi:hypothetical protein
MFSFTKYDSHGERADLYRAILRRQCEIYPTADETFILSQMCSESLRIADMSIADCAAELERMNGGKAAA